MGRTLVTLAAAALAAQIPFEQAARDLQSPDASARLKSVQLLKEAAYPEAAIPLAHAIADTQDEVQLAAIAAELNIFLAEHIVPKKRVGLVVEVRNPILAEPAFAAGPSVLGALPVPVEVIDALRFASRDDNPRVALEALYGFGVLGVSPFGVARRELLRRSGPDIAALLGVPDPAMRYAAVRVMGRLFAKRADDEPIDPGVGDAVIIALNDKDRTVTIAAMEALGSMRYERGVQALTDLFTFHGKGDVAEAALDALAHIAHETSAPLFVAQLAAKSATQRAIAIDGLARGGDRARLADISRVADADRSDAVVLAATFASVLLANGSVDRIVEAVARPKQRDQAQQYLVELAPGRSAAFARYLMDPDERIRLAVVTALGVSTDPAALPLLEALLQDRSPSVARAAEHAVARLRAAQTKPAG
jgi:HEAT repeat protein